MFWALEPSESYKNQWFLKVSAPGTSRIIEKPKDFQCFEIWSPQSPLKTLWFWRSLASWSFCWPCQASRTSENQWFWRSLVPGASVGSDRSPEPMKINHFEGPWPPGASAGHARPPEPMTTVQWPHYSLVPITQSLRASNRSVLVGEGIESAACMYNVGPGGGVLYAAALKCEVICQGCAAVLIEKLIYLRRFAHAAVPEKQILKKDVEGKGSTREDTFFLTFQYKGYRRASRAEKSTCLWPFCFFIDF